MTCGSWHTNTAQRDKKFGCSRWSLLWEEYGIHINSSAKTQILRNIPHYLHSWISADAHPKYLETPEILSMIGSVMKCMQDSLRPWPSHFGGVSYRFVIESDLLKDWQVFPGRSDQTGEDISLLVTEKKKRERGSVLSTLRKDAKPYKENLIKNDLKSLRDCMLWPNISNVLKLWVLGVVFQARMGHLDYHFESLVAEFKLVIPRMTKCPLYPSLSRTNRTLCK